MNKVNRYKVYGINIQTEIEFSELNFSDELDCSNDIYISYGIIDPHIRKYINNGEITHIGENITWFSIKDVATYCIKNGSQIIIEPYQNALLKDIKSYILGSCMGFILHQRKLLAIHGGALEFDNKGVIIVGESGAGKSTLTTGLRLRGFNFITDDLATINKNTFNTINPGYPAQRLCKDVMERFDYDLSNYTRIDLEHKTKYMVPVNESFVNHDVTLSAIFELSVGDVPSVNVEEITGIEKLNLLLRNVYSYRWIKNLSFASPYFKQITKLADEVPIYKITRPIDKFTVNEQIDLIESKLNIIKNKKVV